MQYIFFFVIACALVVLTGCGESRPDYAAAAACQAKGETPGTKEYEDCLKIEKIKRLSAEQQQREDQQEQREKQQLLLRH